MRGVRLGLVVLAIASASGVSAQVAPKIEIVPNIPHHFLAVAFSADGTRVLSGSLDRSIKLWHVSTGALLRTFDGHSDFVFSVAFSPDGALVLSGSYDKTLRLWNAISGALVRVFEGHAEGVTSVAFSPDGSRILSGSWDQTLKLWDAATGTVLRTFEGHFAGVRSVAFSPDGAFVASGSADGTLRLWNAHSGDLVRVLEGHADWVNSVAFSADGARLVSGSGSDRKNIDNTVRLWDSATGELLRTFRGNASGVFSVALSPDGTRVASGSYDMTGKLWDTASSDAVYSFRGQTVVFSPDGTRVLSADGQTMKLSDVISGDFLLSFGVHSAWVNRVWFAPDGARVLATVDKTATIWDSASGALLRTIDGLGDMVVSPDGTLAVETSDKRRIKLWSLSSGVVVRTFEGHSAQIWPMTFSPDGFYVLTGSLDQRAMLWEVATGRLARTFEGQFDTAAFSRDGKLVLSSGLDRTIKLWDSTTGTLLRTFEERPVGPGGSSGAPMVAFSPDGAFALSGSGESDKTVKLFDVASGALVRTFSGHAIAVAFSPDGALVLSGGADRTLKLWDAASGALVHTLVGHYHQVNSVTFSNDGRRIASGSTDGTIRIWSTETGEALAVLLAAPNGEWLTITSDGFFDASARGTEFLTVVRGLEAYSINQFYQVLYRPDLVREKLSGDLTGRVKAAAVQLDLAKLLDTGRVPHVAITSHNARSMSAIDRVTVEARIADQGGGIGRAEWRINGITVSVVEKGAWVGQPITLSQTMVLDPGQNTIELTVFNGANLMASDPARARVTWTGSEPTVPPRLHVLAVGVNNYLDANLKLTYAVADAKTLAAALKEAGQGQYESVTLTHVLDSDATASRLDAVFKDLAAKIRPRDVFVFFAAGHGKTLDGRYYFIPHDLRYHTEQSLKRDAIGQDRLQAWFTRIRAKKAVLMFDTCEAGSLTERQHTRGLEQKAALGRLIQATGRATLTASTASQQAWEGHGGHGVFTFAVLDALARADVNNNGLIELAELIQHIDNLVPAITEKRWGARQYPQMDASGANFPLARQIPALAPTQDHAIIIPTKPTHVTAEAVQIFKEAGGGGGVVQRLPPFTTVTLVKTERGWFLIARDGKLLGYAAQSKLRKLN